MKRQLRCKDAVESQYYATGKKDICALCCDDENLLSSGEVKYERDVQGKDTLPLYDRCVKLDIDVPVKKERQTNFVEKWQQGRETTKKKRTKYANIRTTTTKKKNKGKRG